MGVREALLLGWPWETGEGGEGRGGGWAREGEGRQEGLLVSMVGLPMGAPVGGGRGREQEGK